MECLVVATHNPKKGVEMATILKRLLPHLEIRTLAAFPAAPEPEESGGSYADNAALKSEAAVLFTRLPSLADDAGLEIDALDGAPGLYSKRFGGEELPFDKKMARILELMKDVPGHERKARFRCCIALSLPGSTHVFQRQWAEKLSRDEKLRVGNTYLLQATCEGCIAFEPKGQGGFGYDPIFFLPELGRHMAELSPEEKHAVSHRGKVLKQFAKFVEEKGITFSRRAEN